MEVAPLASIQLSIYYRKWYGRHVEWRLLWATYLTDGRTLDPTAFIRKDLHPILEHLLSTLHKNELGPQAVLD